MFKASGSKLEILMQMGQEFDLSTKEARMIFEYIENHPEILVDKESLTKEETASNETTEEKKDMLNLLLPEYGYYLNVKRITIVMLAAVLDLYITNGMVSAGLTLLGTELQAIIKLKEEKLCLVKEMLCNHQKLHNEADLSRYERECVNNDIQCHFNCDGICTLSQEQIAIVLNNLSDKDVIEKVGKKYKAHIF